MPRQFFQSSDKHLFSKRDQILPTQTMPNKREAPSGKFHSSSGLVGRNISFKSSAIKSRKYTSLSKTKSNDAPLSDVFDYAISSHSAAALTAVICNSAAPNVLYVLTLSHTTASDESWHVRSHCFLSRLKTFFTSWPPNKIFVNESFIRTSPQIQSIVDYVTTASTNVQLVHLPNHFFEKMGGLTIFQNASYVDEDIRHYIDHEKAYGNAILGIINALHVSTSRSSDFENDNMNVIIRRAVSRNTVLLDFHTVDQLHLNNLAILFSCYSRSGSRNILDKLTRPSVDKTNITAEHDSIDFLSRYAIRAMSAHGDDNYEVIPVTEKSEVDGTTVFPLQDIMITWVKDIESVFNTITHRVNKRTVTAESTIKRFLRALTRSLQILIRCLPIFERLKNCLDTFANSCNQSVPDPIKSCFNKLVCPTLSILSSKLSDVIDPDIDVEILRRDQSFKSKIAQFVCETFAIKSGNSSALDISRKAWTNTMDKIIKHGAKVVDHYQKFAKAKYTRLRLDFSESRYYFFTWERASDCSTELSDVSQLPTALINDLTTTDEYSFIKVTNIRKHQIGITQTLNSLNIQLSELFRDILKASVELVDAFIDKNVYDQQTVFRLFEFVTGLTELDSFIARVKFNRKYKCVRPKLLNHDDLSPLAIKNCRNLTLSTFFPVDFFMQSHICNFQLITGENGVGKTKYIETLLYAIILSQSGNYLPASHCQLPLFQSIYYRTNSNEMNSLNLSRFFVEMRNVSTCLREICDELSNSQSKVFVGIDELGNGTSTAEGLCLAKSTAQILSSEKSRVFTMFTTHFKQLCRMEIDIDNIVNVFITFRENDHLARTVSVSDSRGIHHEKFSTNLMATLSSSYGISTMERLGGPSSMIELAKKLRNRLTEEDEETENMNNMSILESKRLKWLIVNCFLPESQSDSQRLKILETKLNEWI